MFSPATRRSSYGATRSTNQTLAIPDSSPPMTPAVDSRRSIFDGSVSNRPKTGTPAPWASRLSVLARTPPMKRDEKIDDGGQVHPVYIGNFPQVVREEQAILLQKSGSGQMNIAGGIDKVTALSWMVCGSHLFVWNYLSPASNKCVALDIPADVSWISGVKRSSHLGSNWLLCVINWNDVCGGNRNVRGELKSVGIVLCNQRTQATVYWPDIYSHNGNAPVTSLASPKELEIIPSHGDGTSQHSSSGSDISEPSSYNSLIASATNGNQYACLALASTSNGQLWQLLCSPSKIIRKKVNNDIFASLSLVVAGGQWTGTKGYPRSLVWRLPSFSAVQTNRQFFMLTEHEIHCFNVDLSSSLSISKLWSHEILGANDEFDVKKDLASEKRIWPLDVQVDDHGKEINILVATHCVDRVSSSSYMRYSLLNMKYIDGTDLLEPANLMNRRVLEKKAPLQVIISKARMEEEETLLSMKLRIGGKPSGSAIILSSDGTATVFHPRKNSSRLYQFDLPYDAGKVLDASVLPSLENGEEGAWSVLTEKAGVWAIPEKAVLLSGVEPAEQSFPQKGSLKGGSGGDDMKNHVKEGNLASGKIRSEAADWRDREIANVGANMQQTAQDEEAEGLVNLLFHDFLHSGRVEDSREKLKKSGAFERDGMINAFVRLSRSLVDTLAKHWTTTRGAEIVSLAVVSTQLMEKQQKHQKFLEFLALSKCHEELCLKQRCAMHIIMEHGEKLDAMIKLRELQNRISQSRRTVDSSQSFGPERDVSGSLWDLIQIVGERARRNTVLLMDRDNAEVFFSKVSELEEVFYCIDRHLDSIISPEQDTKIQIKRACELANACATLVRSAMHYRNEHQMWYPSPDGLMPWYCQHVVRNGLWALANFMVQVLNEYEVDLSLKSDVCSHLEVLANIVLEAYLGAITAKVELEEEHKGLAEEYWHRRDVLLDLLYEQIKVFVEFQCQAKDSMEEAQEEKELIFRRLSTNLLSTARRHEGYHTLWNICHDLNDTALLKNFMHESMGPKGGFCYFVFEQLYKERQYSKLLRLGEEFPEEIATFLKDHPDLLWLHEIFLHRFSSASETLHVLALSENKSFTTETEEEMMPGFADTELQLPDRKQLLYLSKIAAMAGQNANCRADAERIDADLRILSCQEEILKVLPDGEEKQKIGHHLLPPGDLIRLCLKAPTPELLLKALDIFAWTSFSFRSRNTTLLEECWKVAIDLDDWEKLHQFSVAEGWSDVDTLRVLNNTVLFQASQRCYGPESESFKGGFDEVLPLRLETMEPSDLMGSASSVEMILMQHKDFPDAGKLMLTAVMLGSARADIDAEDGVAPME
ncbi:hypothetical protein Droror1_Dr00022914 [Drosera rotundifolia]